MQRTTLTDHRVRVGREKREKMRERLLIAVMVCYAKRDCHTTPGIDDVTREASVSRATFYMHFNSIEDAFNAVLGQLDADLKIVEGFFDQVDPLARLITGTLIFLFRSVTDSVWAGFVSGSNYLSVNLALIGAIERHLLNAKKAKQLRFSEVAVARTLLVGSMSEAMRFISKNKGSERRYVEGLTVMVFPGCSQNTSSASNLFVLKQPTFESMRRIICPGGVILGLANCPYTSSSTTHVVADDARQLGRPH